MREPNPRVRPKERFRLSLDGRQAASIVAGVLVVLGVVFVLGLNVGRQLSTRRGDAARAGDLEALDRVPAAPAPAKPDPLTFHDRLTQSTPAPPPPPDTPAAPPPAPAPAARASPTAEPAPAAAAAAPEPAKPPPPPQSRSAQAPPAQKPWTVQLAAAEDRAEAERVAVRFAGLNPRIEEAVVPGKGRFFRVRVGGFDTKDAAQKYLRDVARETGAKGIVTTSR